MRRANDAIRHVGLIQLISIHALHEESDVSDFDKAAQQLISIHALHEESDRTTSAISLSPRFQSTLSMRRAILPADDLTSTPLISIHALHEESDASVAFSSRSL